MSIALPTRSNGCATTRVPGLILRSQPGPWSRTSQQNSWPKTTASSAPGNCASKPTRAISCFMCPQCSRTCRSEPQMPQCSTCTSTCPRPGSGSGRSATRSSVFWQTTAFTFTSPIQEPDAGPDSCGHCPAEAGPTGDTAVGPHSCGRCPAEAGPTGDAAVGPHSCGRCPAEAGPTGDTAVGPHSCGRCPAETGPTGDAAVGPHSCGRCPAEAGPTATRRAGDGAGAPAAGLSYPSRRAGCRRTPAACPRARRPAGWSSRRTRGRPA